MSKKALIAGASGLIGSELIQILLKQPEYSEIVVFVRKELPLKDPKLKQIVIDFDDMVNYSNEITGDAVFVCLGSTKKKTPDKTLYWKIDHDYPMQLAQIAKQNNVEQFHLVSSIGADAKSDNFYLKMKGQTMADIETIGIKSLYIYQPSLITGARKEFRLIEKLATGIMKMIDPLLTGSWKRYRSIPAKNIAQAMVNRSLKNETGTFIYTTEKIKELA